MRAEMTRATMHWSLKSCAAVTNPSEFSNEEFTWPSTSLLTAKMAIHRFFFADLPISPLKLARGRDFSLRYEVLLMSRFDFFFSQLFFITFLVIAHIACFIEFALLLPLLMQIIYMDEFLNFSMKSSLTREKYFSSYPKRKWHIPPLRSWRRCLFSLKVWGKIVYATRE